MRSTNVCDGVAPGSPRYPQAHCDLACAYSHFITDACGSLLQMILSIALGEIQRPPAVVMLSRALV